MRSALAVKPFKRLFDLLRLDRREILYIYLFALVGGTITLTLPLGIQAIINLISGGQLATSWGVLIAFVAVGVAFTGAMQVMQISLSEHIKQRLFVRSTLEFAYRLPHIRPDQLHGRYLPELVNRFFDTFSIQKGLNKVLLDIPVSALQILLGLALLSFYHPFFIAFAMFLIALLWAVYRFTGAKGLETSLEESKYKYTTAYWLEELGRSNSTFKLAGETTLPLQRADELASKYTKARQAHFKVLLGHYWAMVVFKTVVTLALLILGGLLVMNERMNIGQFVAAEIVIILVLNAVEKIILGLDSVYDVLTSLEKIANVTDLPLEKQDGLKLPVTLEQGGAMAVELRKVSFRSHWSGNPVLDTIDLVLRPGEKVCITGPNGSGKSTLLHMVAGLVDPDQGTVMLDGQGLRSLDLESARSAMGDSFTHEEIFSGTVMENIVMGRPWISEEQARAACVRTGLLSMLSDLPDGLLTVLDPLGSRLPQSLVRRIIIARCLAGRPRLVLYEDDALPLPANEHDVLLELLTGKDAPFTLIAVSNDPLFQRHFQRIVSLDGGRITDHTQR
ncbi:MAG: ATP-binding cassette domain-containing protein [Flavobacteriales bacterium]|jgi:ABC-type bacteriocin/lantibiotic exporter with double-glycine peptidase domain|nr:ATP-binding cassette domain-containing protein [Flavobacteriales bacterium]